MIGKEFMNRIGNNQFDFLQSVLDILKKLKIKFCVIGGLAVNAYCEPVVSLDLDIVVEPDKLEKLISVLKKKFMIKKFPHSINVSASGSDFRIQIQLDKRYLSFLEKTKIKNILGYRMPVASIENVLRGKIWSATDESRRKSKRQKDFADIIRLVESKPDLISLVPKDLREVLGL